MIKMAALTDVGKRREINQDVVYATDQTLGKLPNLFIVADGMGGRNAGDYASRCAVGAIVSTVDNTLEENPTTILRDSIVTANALVKRQAETNIHYTGMGTTVVAATFLGHKMYVANVGDSRLYIFSKDEIRQVTTDHSLVEEMIRMGGLNRKDARNHPDKNIITRAVGVKDYVKVDCFQEEVFPGDVILLCSDGLSNMLEDEEMAEIVLKSESLEQGVQELVNMANDRGGLDNISAILIRPFPEDF